MFLIVNEALLDFEADSLYVLRVSISDGVLADSSKVTIQVLDANDPPIIEGAEFAIDEPMPGDEVGVIHFSDQDKKDTLTASIISGNLNDAFELVNDSVLIVSSSYQRNVFVDNYFLTIQVTDIAGSTAESEFIVDFAFVILSNDQLIKDVSVYPNPSQSTISISNDDEVTSVSIFDLNGKLLLTQNDHFRNVKVDHLEAGIYMVKIKDNKGHAKSIRLQINK